MSEGREQMMMSIKRSGLFTVTLLLMSIGLGLSGVGLANEGDAAGSGADPVYVTLEEAYTVAEDKSPKVRMARLELEDAHLAYEHVRSTALMRPDPIASLQA